MGAEFVCVMCSVVHTSFHRNRVCEDCFGANHREAQKAIGTVTRAKRKGMPKATAFACVDCGKPASVYEHRDYTKPLDVVPTCRACNTRRGVAFNSFYRPEHMAQPTDGGVVGADEAGSFGLGSHGTKFCPGEPLNATHLNCEA